MKSRALRPAGLILVCEPDVATQCAKRPGRRGVSSGPDSLTGLFTALLACLALNAAAQEIPPLPSDSWIVDEAGLIDPERIAQLNAVLQDLHQQTGAAVAVLTYHMGPRGWSSEQAEEFAARVYAQWRLGGPPYDEGVLFLVAVTQTPPAVQPVLRVGQGLEVVLGRAAVARLLGKYAYLPFGEQNYDQGIFETTWAVALVLAGAYQIQLRGTPPISNDPLAAAGPDTQMLLWLVLALIVAALIYRRFRPGGQVGPLWPWHRRRRRSLERTSQWSGAFSRGGSGPFGGR